MRAVFSARSRVAVLNHDDGGLRCIHYPNVDELKPIEPALADQLLTGASDFQTIDAPLREISRHFVAEVQNSDALDYVLFLLDGRLSPKTHSAAAKSLEPLISQSGTLKYLKRIFYARPLPQSANVDAAKEELTSSYANVRKFLATLSSVQETVEKVRTAWDAIDLSNVVPEINQNKLTGAEVEGICVRFGLFRDIVEKIVAKANPVHILLDAKVNPELQQTLPSVSFLLQAWVTPLKQDYKFPRFHPLDEVSGDQYTLCPDSFDGKSDPSPFKKNKDLLRWDDARDAALAQVEEIAKLVGQQKDARANEILEELIAAQLKYPNGERDVVKSLCNIASRARYGSRDDFAVICLTRALTIKSTDPVAFFQLGTQLRDLELFDEARRAYDKSLELGESDDRYNVQRTLSAKAHVLTEQGKYDEAIIEYGNIPFVTDSPGLLTAIADVYRKKGDYKSAMARYVMLLDMDKSLHRAHAGKAEIAKRRGDPHRALRIYNDLLRNEKYDIDSRSRTVYELASCHLLKRVVQYPKALAIARAIVQREPYNLGARLQLSSILTVQGDANSGIESLHGKSISSPKDKWRSELLEGLTLFRLNTIAAAKQHLIDRVDLSAVLPEDKPYATSAVAFAHAKVGHLDKAAQLLAEIPSIDRGISDFRAVLTSHLQILEGQRFSPLYVPLRRRTARQLRDARDALLLGDTERAFACELEYLLLAA